MLPAADSIVALIMAMYSVLIPSKGWFAPDQPIMINVKSDAKVSLVLTDFAGKAQEAKGETTYAGGASVDVKSIFPIVGTPGTYVLYAVPEGKKPEEFAGTPIVISVRGDKRIGAPAGPMVVHVSPLRYLQMETEKGSMKAIFNFDVAPNTAETFLSLAAEGYFDGLKFHRIIPEFVVQGGDPRGNGAGGPGFTIPEEFNDLPHEFGVLSMARQGDPAEGRGVLPRAPWKDSAGSQFFICLNYANTRQLDKKYTVFGKIVTGEDTIKALAATPLVEGTDKPQNPPTITRATVHAVTATDNPYKSLLTK